MLLHPVPAGVPTRQGGAGNKRVGTSEQKAEMRAEFEKSFTLKSILQT